jgi:Domain of unknown function (DUF4091)
MLASWLGASIALAGALLFTQGPSEQPSFTVWAVHDGVKVKRDDRQHPDRARNAVWDGRTIRLVAARNEVIAFQVIVEAGASGLDGLSASLPRLTRRGGGGAIEYRPPAIDPTAYRDRPIQVFSEHYMSVTRGSRATWVFRPESPTAPKDALGWIPVQLVPENARPGRGGFPLRVDAMQNQAIWFDVYVARARAPGSYRGDVRISARGGARQIPIELDVVDLEIPDENTLAAMVYYQVEQPELYHGRNLDPAYHRFAKRHRVEFVHAYNPARARAALGRLTGRDFTRDQGYDGPGEGLPNRIVPRTFYGPGADFASAEGVWKTADEWMEFLEQFPHVRTFLYMPDEPRPPRFPEIVALGERLKSNPGKGRGLPTLVTRGYTPELAPAIDIWCSGPQHYDIERATRERAAGKSYWFYNGGRPAGPSIVIDSPATDARVIGWAAFKHDADGYFYWHGVHWRHNTQKKIGDRNQDVWANPVTFDNRTEGKDDNGFINGDGVLVYPGEEKLHSEQDRGIAGPVSTIQMANLRRGLQDHAVLTIARRRGLDREIDAALSRLVPRVFSDAVQTEIGFSEQGNDYEEARQRLLRAIARR